MSYLWNSRFKFFTIVILSVKWTLLLVQCQQNSFWIFLQKHLYCLFHGHLALEGTSYQCFRSSCWVGALSLRKRRNLLLLANSRRRRRWCWRHPRYRPKGGYNWVREIHAILHNGEKELILICSLISLYLSKIKYAAKPPVIAELLEKAFIFSNLIASSGMSKTGAQDKKILTIMLTKNRRMSAGKASRYIHHRFFRITNQIEKGKVTVEHRGTKEMCG